MRNLISAKYLSVVLASFAIANPVHSSAQALTGAAIIAEADALETKLQNLSAGLSGDVMTATNNAGTQVSVATDHLKEVLNTQVNVPITQLNDNVRDQALLLNSMVTQMSLLVDRQRSCLFAQADVFVAGINTAVATLKKGVPLVSAGGPTVTSFQFDGHLTPNTVPRDGGGLVVKGFKLWPDDIAPLVTITDSAAKVLEKPVPARATDDNSYRFALASPFIASNAGACLYINSVPRQRKRILGVPVPGDYISLQEVTLPICIPQETTTKVRLTAQITYDTASNDQHPLDYQNFRFDNSDCGHTHAVSMTKGWSLPADYTILSVDSRQSDLRNNNNTIAFSFNGNSITAAGTQDSPTCVSVHIPFAPSIDKLQHSAIWSYDARPIVSGTAYTATNATGNSDLLDTVIPATQLCASVAKLANIAGRHTSVSYTITPVVNGTPSTPYSSPVFTTSDASDSFTIPPTAAFNGEFTISGVYSPTPVNGKCQVCVTLNALNTCSF
jgi:hypothetical protein